MMRVRLLSALNRNEQGNYRVEDVPMAMRGVSPVTSYVNLIEGIQSLIMKLCSVLSFDRGSCKSALSYDLAEVKLGLQIIQRQPLTLQDLSSVYPRRIPQNYQTGDDRIAKLQVGKEDRTTYSFTR
jgi:hypothetical protein